MLLVGNGAYPFENRSLAWKVNEMRNVDNPFQWYFIANWLQFSALHCIYL